MESPYLTTKEAAAFLRYKSTHGFMRAVHRRHIPHLLRDRERLFLRTDLERVWARPAGYRERRPRVTSAA